MNVGGSGISPVEKAGCARNVQGQCKVTMVMPVKN